jgi:hypothetical protein
MPSSSHLKNLSQSRFNKFAQSDVTGHLRIAPHHFTHCYQFTKQSVRVLKPGGTLLVQDHVLPENPPAGRSLERFEKPRDPSHNQAYTRTESVDMFGANGLKGGNNATRQTKHQFQPILRFSPL